MMKIYWLQAVLWLRECQDKRALREDRLETVEWALLIFAVIGVIAIIPAIVDEVIWLWSLLK